jgi:hypothetical protein
MGDGSLAPNRFVQSFNQAIVGLGLNELEKVRLFKRLVRVNDPPWDAELVMTIHTLEQYQNQFLDQFWNRATQEAILREFEETRFKYDNVTTFIHQMDTWFNRLSSLSHIPLSRGDIIAKLISKLPGAKQDILRSHDNRSYPDFKARVTRIISSKDFRARDGNQVGGSGADPPKTYPKRNFEGGYRNLNETTRNSQYPRANLAEADGDRRLFNPSVLELPESESLARAHVAQSQQPEN